MMHECSVTIIKCTNAIQDVINIAALKQYDARMQCAVINAQIIAICTESVMNIVELKQYDARMQYVINIGALNQNDT